VIVVTLYSVLMASVMLTTITVSVAVYSAKLAVIFKLQGVTRVVFHVATHAIVSTRVMIAVGFTVHFALSLLSAKTVICSFVHFAAALVTVRLAIQIIAKIAGISNSATRVTLPFVTIVTRLLSAQSVWPISAITVKNPSRSTLRHACSVFAIRDTKRFIDVVSTAQIVVRGGATCIHFRLKSTTHCQKAVIM